jgi:hypothetical protein
MLDEMGFTSDLDIISNVVGQDQQSNWRERNKDIRRGLGDLNGFQQKNSQKIKEAAMPGQQPYIRSKEYRALADDFNTTSNSYNTLRGDWDNQKNSYDIAYNTYKDTFPKIKSAYDNAQANNAWYHKAQIDYYTNKLNSGASNNGGWINKAIVDETNIYNNLMSPYNALIDQNKINKTNLDSAIGSVNTYQNSLNDLFTKINSKKGPLEAAYQLAQGKTYDTSMMG